MKNYVKKRLDEITKINLYDIGLSEEELKRRKNKKYALKKALKGCTYGDVLNFEQELKNIFGTKSINLKGDINKGSFVSVLVNLLA